MRRGACLKIFYFGLPEITSTLSYVIWKDVKKREFDRIKLRPNGRWGVIYVVITITQLRYYFRNFSLRIVSPAVTRVSVRVIPSKKDLLGDRSVYIYTEIHLYARRRDINYIERPVDRSGPGCPGVKTLGARICVSLWIAICVCMCRSSGYIYIHRLKGTAEE